MKYQYLNIIIFFGCISYAQIQQGETTVDKENDFESESVDVERVYEPNVENAEKIKQSPEILAVPSKKIPVTYGLKDVEAASDFETTDINAEELPIQPVNPYNNYVRLGAGNNFTFLGDGFISYSLNESTIIGASTDYYSTAGNIPNVSTDDDEMKWNGEGFLKFNFDASEADIRLGGGFHDLNYYGIDENFGIPENTDVSQHYKNIYVAGNYHMLDHFLLDNVNIKGGFFGDNYNSSESTFDLSTGLKNSNIFDFNLLNDLHVGGKMDFNLNMSNTSFKEINDFSYKTFNTGISPQFMIENDFLTLDLGANIQYLNADNWDENDVYVFPKAELVIKSIPEFGIYGGITGDIEHNRYQNFYQENPFLVPEQEIKPLINEMEIYAGLRGAIGENFKYDGSVNFKSLKNIPFFVRYNMGAQPYMNRNSFMALYDDARTTVFTGQLNYVGTSNLNVGANIQFQSFRLENLDEAWEKPMIKSSITADYKLLNEKLILGGDLFFVGERFTTTLGIEPAVGNQTSSAITLDPYIDFNLNATYMFLERWGAFIEINNVLNKNYERFLDYQVQGITGIGGVIFRL